MSSPNVFQNALSSLGPTLAGYLGNWFSGTLRWVSSTAATASDANTGIERELPKATHASAYTASAAGDLIICEASHAETIGAAGTLGTAGVMTIGLGSGTSRPRFTSNVAGVMWTVSAARQRFANLYFPASTAATTARVTSSSTDIRLRSCYFECGANDTTATVSLGGNNPYLDDVSCVATASRPARGIRVTGAINGLTILNSLLDGGAFGWTQPALSVEAAVTDAYFENVRLANYSDCVFTTTGSTYQLLGLRAVDNTGSRVTIAA